jgi:hypothetical protein
MEILLKIIGRIGENARIEPPFDAICTIYHHSVFIRIKEFIVKKNFPLLVKKLVLAVCVSVACEIVSLPECFK